MWKVEWDHDYRDGSFANSERFATFKGAAIHIQQLVTDSPDGEIINISYSEV
jgi:hypothetical protein